MPITFESIQDPYGLRSASGALAQAMMQKNLLERQEQSLIAQEKRAEERQVALDARSQALKKQYGSILGPALTSAMDSSLSMSERLAPLQQYVSATGDTSVLPLLKEIGKEARVGQLFQSLGLSLPGTNARDFSGPVTPQIGEIGNQQPSTNPVTGTIAFPSPDQKEGAFASLAALPDDALLALSLDPSTRPIAETVLKMKSANQVETNAKNAQFQEERKYHERGAKQTEERATKLRASLPKKKMALNFAKDAVLSGDVGRFSLANLAERTGIKELQTAKGSQLITAGKENLIGNLSNVSAKAQNQWLEQRFATMFPEIGKSKWANLTTEAMLEADTEIDEVYLKNYDQIAQEDMQKYNFVRRDIDQRVEAASQAEQKDIMQKASYKTRQIYEAEQGTSKMIDNYQKPVPKGTPLTPEMAKIFYEKYNRDAKKAIENAEKLGYFIPTQDEAKRWQ